jgi:hypothetical protein
VRNVFGKRVLRTNTAGVNGRGFARLRKSVVARVEVLAFFEVLGKMIGFGREFAVEAKETLFIRRERL